MKVLGADECPDCIEAFSVLNEKNIDYQYINIIENTKNLKEFLDLRDNREEFDYIKESGMYGIPCFLFEDGTITFDLNEALEKADD